MTSASGQREHFERLMLPHLDAAYNLARSLTGNPQDAEDVVQEAYLKAFGNFHRCVDTNSAAWLLTIVRRTCLSWLEKHRPDQRTVTFDETQHSGDVIGPAARGLGQDPAVSFGSDSETLHRALQALPAIFREVIVLRELEELSYKDIASIIDVPVGTVMSRLARSRKRLQQIMESQPGERQKREM